MSNEETASPAEGEVIKFPIEKLVLESTLITSLLLRPSIKVATE